MTPRFVFRPAARAELMEAREWYEARRVGLGHEFALSIAATITHIAERPDLYPEIWPGLRRAVLLDFPYGVFYRAKPRSIEIVAIFHHRRDPRVWQARAAV